MEIDRLRVSRLISALYEKLGEKGLKIQLGRDFKKLEELVSKTGKLTLTEHFRRTLNTYSPEQAFWLGGFNSSGDLVAVSAARLDILGSWTLEQYWREYWPRCYPSADGGPVVMADGQPDYAKSITGRIVYFGDLWACEDHPVDGIAQYFSPAIQLLSMLEWPSVDWFYAWARPGFLERGFAFKCRFSQTYPGIRWVKRPSTIDPDLWVMANSRQQLSDLVAVLSSELLEE